MSSESILTVCNLSKCFKVYDKPNDRLKEFVLLGSEKCHREFWALRDINFSVTRGESLGIVGRNGSGKSTLLQLICGTLWPTTGTISYEGRVSALLELGSGFNPEFTGRENVYLHGAITGLQRSRMDAIYDDIASFADIGEFIDRPVKHYSSGMAARLAFSAAIHVEPDLLIVDEILSVGDAPFQKKCKAKFMQVRDRGCSILFVSHDEYLVRTLCDQALYISGGLQVLHGPSGQVMTRYKSDNDAAQPLALSTSDSNSVIISRSSDNPHGRSYSFSGPGGSHNIDMCLYRIEEINLCDSAGAKITEVQTGQSVTLSFRYTTVANDTHDHVSFVFNLYRQDDLYICGTTTLMDAISPTKCGIGGTVEIHFPNLLLLAGDYKFRVAINDHTGLQVLVSQEDVCPFTVIDDHQAAGLLNLSREWTIRVS